MTATVVRGWFPPARDLNDLAERVQGVLLKIDDPPHGIRGFAFASAVTEGLASEDPREYEATFWAIVTVASRWSNHD